LNLQETDKISEYNVTLDNRH